MSRDEDPQEREADRAASFLREGRLMNGGDRPADTGRSLDRFRLKRSVDCLRTDDGTVHLLHDGLEDQYEIEHPTKRDLRMLDLLRSGFRTERQICDELQSHGFDTDTVTQALTDLDQLGVIERDQGRELLSEEQAERFDRQLIYLADIAPKGQSAWQLQARLRGSHVLVLGCGGLGSWVATGLALTGVGQLTLVDDDTVELSNLNRQMLFRTADIGRPKVQAARETLTAIAPDLGVTAIERRLETSGEIAELTASTDFLAMAADYPPYELTRTVNQACLDTGTAWIGAGQIPPVIRVGPIVIPGQTPCLECQQRAFRRDFPHYETLIRHRTANPPDAATLGPATGAMGSLVAMEIVHYLTGSIPPATAGQAVVIDLHTLQVEHEPVEPDPECECQSLAQSSGNSSSG